jgi:hypothetical protein
MLTSRLFIKESVFAVFLDEGANVLVIVEYSSITFLHVRLADILMVRCVQRPTYGSHDFTNALLTFEVGVQKFTISVEGDIVTQRTDNVHCPVVNC